MNNIEPTLEQIFKQVNSGNALDRRQAEDQAAAFEKQNLGFYAWSLCKYLANPSKLVDDRVLSGILMRNLLTAKDELLLQEKQRAWLSLPFEQPQSIKEVIYPVLNDQAQKVRQIAAQIVAKIALAELPANRWHDLIPTLLNQVTNPQAPPTLKQSTLDTFGYLCEEIDPDVLKNQTDDILTAVVHGMRPQETDVLVKRSATTALFNALDFCRKNFETPRERQVLMEVILDATLAQDLETRITAYNILNELPSLHYEKLPDFMQRIFKVTLDAMRDHEEDIVKLAIEFWCAICDEELDIMEENQALQGTGRQPSRQSLQFIKGACQYVAGILLDLLTKQEDEVDPDDWTVSMAAGGCLSLFAQAAGDDILPHVIPFVEKYITSQNWKEREAAVYAFGSILEGPSAVIQTFITQALKLLLNYMKDPVPAVKDTVTWTLGRICKLHYVAIGGDADFVLRTVGDALGDNSPRVSSHACWAILNLSIACQDEPHNPFVPHFETVVRLLLMTTDRPDARAENLRTAAYEALNVVITTAPAPALPSLERLVPVILERLEKTFMVEVVNQDDRMIKAELQGLLCGVIQVLAQRLEDQMLQFADRIMTILLNLLKTQHVESTIYEEALLCTSAMINAIDLHFLKYMDDFFEPLLKGLNNCQEPGVCNVAVEIVGDLARALNLNLLRYCDLIVAHLLQAIQNKHLDRSVKPPIISAFGDIALAIGGRYEAYLDVVMSMLKQASETVTKSAMMENSDRSLINYLEVLADSVCEAYGGIIQGLRGDNKVDKIFNYRYIIMTFINYIAQKPNRSDSLARGAVGIVGDLAASFGPRVKNDIATIQIQQLIEETLRTTQNRATKETAEWTLNVIRQL